MKKNLFAIIMILLLLSTSCQETSGRGNLKIILETGGQTKSIKPDESSSTVVKYNVKGIGPGGKTFSKDSSSKSITIDGLTMGTWTVTANGYNSNSVCVLSGSKTFGFDNSTKSVYVNMSSFSGTGNLQVNLHWSDQISNPIIVVSLSGDKESYVNESFSSQESSSTMKYSKTNLEAGNYLLTVKLYNGESFVSGCVEALQIVNSKTTTGEVFLSNSEDSNQTAYDSEFSGHFAVVGKTSLPSSVEAGTGCTIKYVLDSSYQSTVQLSWYLDGTLFNSNAKEINITPTVGDHIINVVFTDNSSEKTGSAYYRFTAKTNAKKGSATFVSKIENDSSKLVLAADSQIGALPDNYYLLVTPSRSSMQVFSIFKNTVQVAANKTYNATDLNYLWLPQVTKIYTNPKMNFFIIQSEVNNVHVLYFNTKTEKIELALWQEQPLSFCDYVSFPPAFIDNVTTVTMVPGNGGSGSIFIFDSGSRSKEILGLTTTDSEVKTISTSSKTKDMESLHNSSGFGTMIGVIDADNSLRFASIQNGSTSSSWYTMTDENLGKVKHFKMLNSRYSVFGTGSEFVIYEYYSLQKLWVRRTSANVTLKAMDVSEDGAFIYVSDNEGNLLSYRSGLTDNFGKIYTQNTSNIITSFALNSSSIVGLDSSGNAYLFEISQESTTL